MSVTTCDVFISYRRESALHEAGHLYAEIQQKLAGRVFMDTKGISPGEHFPDKLDIQLKQCRVLLLATNRFVRFCSK